MTKIAFISKEVLRFAPRDRPYIDSVSTMRVYIVRDDTRFNLLVKTVEQSALEKVAKEFKVIEEEQVVTSISRIWSFGEDE